MKRPKKLFAFVLAFALVISFAVTAFADNVALNKEKGTELNVKIEGKGKGSVTVYSDGGTFTVTDESDRKEGKIHFDKETEATLTVTPAEGYYVSKSEGVTKDGGVLTVGKKSEEIKVTFSETSKADKEDALSAETEGKCVGSKITFTVTLNEHGKGWVASNAEIFETTSEGSVKVGDAKIKDGAAVLEISGKEKAGEASYYAVLTYWHQNQLEEHKHYEYVLTKDVKAEWIEHAWNEGELNKDGDKMVYSCENEGCDATYEEEYIAPAPTPTPPPAPKPTPDNENSKDKDSVTIIIGEKGGNGTEKPEKNPTTGAPAANIGTFAAVAFIAAAVMIFKKSR